MAMPAALRQATGEFHQNFDDSSGNARFHLPI
jgi:hypothetical protein